MTDGETHATHDSVKVMLSSEGKDVALEAKQIAGGLETDEEDLEPKPILTTDSEGEGHLVHEGEEEEEQEEEDEVLKQVVAQTDASGVAQYPRAPDDGSDRYREHGFFAHICLTLARLLCCTNDAPVAAQRRSMVFGDPILLPGQLERSKGKKCLVLDLDETLVHSSFKPVPNPDYIIPVEIEGVIHNVYVLKRPGVDDFLVAVQKIYEVVVFTASLAKYANPLLDQLDVNKTIDFRLFRESCTHHQGAYVKDLALLGRPLKDTIIVDNSPASYMFHPEHAIEISSFIDDPEDRELTYCLEFLENIADCSNVTKKLAGYEKFIRDSEMDARRREMMQEDE